MNSLPTELVQSISLYLDEPSFSSLSHTCTRYKYMLYNYKHINRYLVNKNVWRLILFGNIYSIDICRLFTKYISNKNLKNDPNIYIKELVLYKFAKLNRQEELLFLFNMDIYSKNILNYLIKIKYHELCKYLIHVKRVRIHSKIIHNYN